jgi:hypothetical protein
MNELERFKTEIDLRDFAASRGYVEDKKQSSQNCCVMRGGADDKIVVAYCVPPNKKSGGAAWYYYSIRDDNDHGSIIDFLQHRGGGNLGEVRKTLRSWCGSSRTRQKSFFPPPVAVHHDLAAVALAWVQAEYRVNVPYLVGRGLGPEVWANPRFNERYRIDKRGNVLFPHYDRLGVCGFEIKNKGFTGFSKGGKKGLWTSACVVGDTSLVFTESAIDGVSYHLLNPDEKTRYMSIGGEMNPTQPALIRAAVERMPYGSSVVLALDHDEGGEKLVERMRGVIPSGYDIRRPLPPVGKDWNEALKNKLGLE